MSSRGGADLRERLIDTDTVRLSTPKALERGSLRLSSRHDQSIYRKETSDVVAKVVKFDGLLRLGGETTPISLPSAISDITDKMETLANKSEGEYEEDATATLECVTEITVKSEEWQQMPERLQAIQQHIKSTMAGLQKLPQSWTKAQNYNDNMQMISRNIENVMMKSIAMGTHDWTTVGGMLEHGTEAFFQKLQKAIGQQGGATICVPGATYTVEVPLVVRSRQYETFGTNVEDTLKLPLNVLKRLFCKEKTKMLPILKDISCVLHPGRMTLVLGGAGSGRSSFLKLLSGSLSQEKVGSIGKMDGTVTYNGLDASTLALYKWCAMVGQKDQHYTHFTCRETIEFAYRATVDRSKINTTDEDDEMQQFRTLWVDFIIAVLGLNNCQNTIMGDSSTKGVSGGESRRISLAEMIVTECKVILGDEISNGLDASSTFEICTFLGAATKALRLNTVLALQQPAPEVCALFDDVIILDEGQILYHGPMDSAMAYFAELGYTCPQDVEIGDFFTYLFTPAGRKYRTKDNAPRTADEFVNCWRESSMNKDQDTSDITVPALANSPEKDFPGCYQRFMNVLHRTWKLRICDKSEIKTKFWTNIILGTLFGTVFWQIKPAEWYKKNMMIMSIASFITSNAVGQLPSLFEQRDIYYKQYRQNFFSPLTYILATMMVEVPYVTMDALLYGSFLYFMTGMVYNVGRLFQFYAIAILFGLSQFSLQRVFAFGIRDFSQAFNTSVFFYLLMRMLNGVMATPNTLPASTYWFFFLNPQSWSIRALALNEYLAPQYATNPCNYSAAPGQPEIPYPESCGILYLKSREYATDPWYLDATYAVLIGYLVLFWGISALFLLVIEFQPIGLAKTTDPNAEATVEGERAATVATAIQRLTSHRVDDMISNQVDLVSDQLFSVNPAPSSTSVGGHAKGRGSVKLDSDFDTMDLTFQDIWYTVTLPSGPVDILKGVNGCAKAGTLTALMGSSGAGKSTLLDVLAGRKTTGKIVGSICVNGAPVSGNFSRQIGYVEQFGVHLPTATVLESLLFAAELRMKSNAQQRQVFCEAIRGLLEMDDISEVLCQSLPAEAQKRLTIGVELAVNPSILFLDEPTTGLDASAAGIVTRVMTNVAATGRAVISTIHQPSVAIFKQFHQLLLMRRGGEVVYFGPLGENGRDIIKYFENFGVPTCPPGYNVSTWMLEVIGAGANGSTVDFHALYKQSELCESNMYELQELVESSEFIEKTVWKPSFWLELKVLTVRKWRRNWRTPSFSFGKYIVLGFVTLITCLIFFQQKYSNVAAVQSRITTLVYAVVITSIYNLFTIIPYRYEQRPVYYRESASKMYGLGAHIVSDVVEIPYIMLQTFWGVNISYFLIGLEMNVWSIAYYNLFFFLSVTLHTYMGIAFSEIAPNPYIGQMMGTVFTTIADLFGGLTVPAQGIPKWYKFLYWFSPLHYVNEGLTTTQFYNDMTDICNPYGVPTNGVCMDEGKVTSSKIVKASDYMLNEFLEDYKYSFRNWDLFILAAWTCCTPLITYIVMRNVSYNKR